MMYNSEVCAYELFLEVPPPARLSFLFSAILSLFSCCFSLKSVFVPVPEAESIPAFISLAKSPLMIFDICTATVTPKE